MDERAIQMFGSTPLGTFRKGYTVQTLDQRFAEEERGA